MHSLTTVSEFHHGCLGFIDQCDLVLIQCGIAVAVEECVAMWGLLDYALCRADASMKLSEASEAQIKESMHNRSGHCREVHFPQRRHCMQSSESSGNVFQFKFLAARGISVICNVYRQPKEQLR